MSGFTDSGSIKVTKEPFTGWAEALSKMGARAEAQISLGLHQIINGLEDDLKAQMAESPAWGQEVADATRFETVGGQFNVAIDDEEFANREYGRDPEVAPSPLVRPFAAAKEDEFGDQVGALLRRVLGL